MIILFELQSLQLISITIDVVALLVTLKLQIVRYHLCSDFIGTLMITDSNIQNN